MQHIITDEEVERALKVWFRGDASLEERMRATLADFLSNRPESTLGKLRPIAEMPEKVPEGCERKFSHIHKDGGWARITAKNPDNCGCMHTHAIDILTPTPDPEAEERQRFEEAMKKAFPHFTFKLHENGSGEYANPHCETSWTAWKLAKAK